MKKVMIVIGIIIVIALVAGGIYFATTKSEKTVSANETSHGDNILKEEGYVFVADGNEIKIGEEFSKEKFGQEKEYSEIASCAFEGLDRTYKYENYEITTYENGDKENILSIYLLDDTAETKEGIKIADSYEQMVEAYGENYQKEDNLYTYTKGNMNLKFIVENDFITSIEYSLITDAK